MESGRRIRSLRCALVHQLLDSPELLAIVDEFFWEHHVP
jgi:hypothetical protein